MNRQDTMGELLRLGMNHMMGKPRNFGQPQAPMQPQPMQQQAMNLMGATPRGGMQMNRRPQMTMQQRIAQMLMGR